jgi:two-component system, LytTR family, sensor kinase
MNIIKLLRFKPYQKLIGTPLLIYVAWFTIDWIFFRRFNAEINVGFAKHFQFVYLPFVIYFYIQYWLLLPKYFLKKKYFSLGIISTFLILVLASLRVFIVTKGYQEALLLGIFEFFQCSFFTFGYWYVTAAIRNERKKNRSKVTQQRLEQLKNELEKSVLASELNFLKLQINPHFLYNALNTFYAQAIPVSMPLAEGILTLSNIMRYAVEGSKSDAKVALSREIDHIKNLIEIQRLRFGKRFFMKLEYDGYVEAKQIPPLIFITFVENIFKHGEIHDPENPAEIKIFATPYDIIFLTKNKKKVDGHKEPSTNIGLKNTLQRLDAFYPERYELEMNDEGDFYSCKLKIKT